METIAHILVGIVIGSILTIISIAYGLIDVSMFV